MNRASARCPEGRETTPRRDEQPPRSRRRTLARLGLLLSLGLTLTCGSEHRAVCASDIDCGSSSSCDRSACVTASGAAREDLRPARVTLHPMGDTTVTSARCCNGLALGDQDLLTVGRDHAGSLFRSYLIFDTSPIEGARVAHAELRLVTNPRWSRSVEALRLVVHQASSGWSPVRLTWARQPGGSGPPLAESVVRPGHNREVTFDVTALASAWASGALPNRGVVLTASQHNTASKVVFFSSQATDPSLRPVVEVQVR